MKQIDFYSEQTGELVVKQEQGSHVVNVYKPSGEHICDMDGYWLVDIIDDSALDYYRFIEDFVAQNT